MSYVIKDVTGSFPVEKNKHLRYKDSFCFSLERFNGEEDNCLSEFARPDFL